MRRLRAERERELQQIPGEVKEDVTEEETEAKREFTMPLV